MAKLLIVEDNEMNRDMLTRRLERRGYDVVTAVNGQEGLDAAESERPDLILLDLSLPIVDGWTVAGILKGKDSTRQIPIIALTAHAMQGDRDKALEAGCDEYDTKPVNLKRLLGTIETLLQGS